MAILTSGTVRATPLGDMWIGTLELPATVDDSDELDLGSTNYLGTKIKGVLYAAGVMDGNNNSSGTVTYQNVGFDTASGTLTLENSGTLQVVGSGDIESGGYAAVSNKKRNIFFVAQSTTE